MALGDLFPNLLDIVRRILGPFGKIFDLVTKFWSTVKRAWSETTNISSQIVAEFNAWRNFSESVPYRTGVISLPAAVKATQDLADQIVAGWNSLVDLARTFKSKLDDVGFEDPAADAREAIAELEQSGFSGLLKRLPRLFRGLEKLLVWLGVLTELAELWITLSDDVTTILEAITAIREEVETGSTVFLSQKNPRRIEKLADGRTIKIRLGNLHS